VHEATKRKRIRIRRFVAEYLVDLNGAAAVRRMGFEGKEPKIVASKLLAHPYAKRLLADAMEKRIERTEVNQDRVLRELALISFSNAKSVMKWGPDGVKLLSSDELSAEDAALIAEVSETTTLHGGTLKAKLHDKVKALELLGSHLGMWKNKHEHTGKDGAPLAPPVINIGFGNGGPGSEPTDPDPSAEG
jgi:phage terminase small subunit